MNSVSLIGQKFTLHCLMRLIPENFLLLIRLYLIYQIKVTALAQRYDTCRYAIIFIEQPAKEPRYYFFKNVSKS